MDMIWQNDSGIDPERMALFNGRKRHPQIINMIGQERSPAIEQGDGKEVTGPGKSGPTIRYHSKFLLELRMYGIQIITRTY